jgi:hypothetical protein
MNIFWRISNVMKEMGHFVINHKELSITAIKQQLTSQSSPDLAIGTRFRKCSRPVPATRAIFGMRSAPAFAINNQQRVMTKQGSSRSMLWTQLSACQVKRLGVD